MTNHAGQSKLLLTVMHESVAQIKQRVANVRSEIQHISTTAPQSVNSQRWVVMVRFIGARILALQPRFAPTPAVLQSGQLRNLGLPTLDVKAAFMHVGSEHMHVSVGGDEPKVFGSVTSQLHALRDWLLGQGARSVAMDDTGVYWLPLYGVLEAAGLDLRMVNGRETRNAPGRKTDMQDAQWRATPLQRPALPACANRDPQRGRWPVAHRRDG